MGRQNWDFWVNFRSKIIYKSLIYSMLGLAIYINAILNNLLTLVDLLWYCDCIEDEIRPHAVWLIWNQHSFWSYIFDRFSILERVLFLCVGFAVFFSSSWIHFLNQANRRVNHAQINFLFSDVKPLKRPQTIIYGLQIYIFWRGWRIENCHDPGGFWIKHRFRFCLNILQCLFKGGCSIRMSSAGEIDIVNVVLMKACME